MNLAKIEKYKKKVNPKISKDISNIFRPYWRLINKSSDYYKLKSIGIDIGRINVKVKKGVERLLEAFKAAALDKIEEKIKCIHQSEKAIGRMDKPRFPKINKKYWPLLYNSMFGKMVVNLSYEDFKMIIHKNRKIDFHSLKFDKKDDMDSKIKPILKKKRNAILILTGNAETTLDELDSVWGSVLKCLPKNAKTAFAYNINDVDKLEVNILTVK